jgi:hypothetical protein
MGGYVTLPTTLDTDQARSWVSRAVAHVGALPPKQPRAKKGR